MSTFTIVEQTTLHVLTAEDWVTRWVDVTNCPVMVEKLVVQDHGR